MISRFASLTAFCGLNFTDWVIAVWSVINICLKKSMHQKEQMVMGLDEQLPFELFAVNDPHKDVFRRNSWLFTMQL